MSDEDEALVRLRELAAQVTEEGPPDRGVRVPLGRGRWATVKPGPLAAERSRALALARLFIALDEQITRNKFLPAEWVDEFEAAAPDRQQQTN